MATTRENRTISDFKSRLVGGGARPNLFEVRMTDLPDFVDDWPSETFQFMCKAAALPASNIAPSMFLLEVVFLRLLETEPLIHGLSPLSMTKISESEMLWKHGWMESQNCLTTWVQPTHLLT